MPVKRPAPRGVFFFTRMKYTIQVNQAGADAANLRGKVDIVDLAIFDAFRDFANGTKCEKKMTEDGRVWFWVSYSLIIDELPYCNIRTTDGVYRRMKNLQAAGIIDFHPDNQRANKTFFAWGAAYDLLISDTDLRMKNRRGTDEKPEGYGLKTGGGTDEKPDNHYTNNHTTKSERAATEKNSLSPAENSTLEAQPLEGKNLPGGAALIEVHDPELPGVPRHDTIPPAPVTDPPAHRINLGDRPTADTPVELQTALRAFYADWPNEWSVGVLENGRGKKYPAEQQKEIVKDFCCWAVKNNQQRDTYRQLNAALQNWFRNEQHSTWKQAKPGNGEKPVYERPKNAIY